MTEQPTLDNISFGSLAVLIPGKWRILKKFEVAPNNWTEFEKNSPHEDEKFSTFVLEHLLRGENKFIVNIWPTYPDTDLRGIPDLTMSLSYVDGYRAFSKDSVVIFTNRIFLYEIDSLEAPLEELIRRINEFVEYSRYIASRSRLVISGVVEAARELRNKDHVVTVDSINPVENDQIDYVFRIHFEGYQLQVGIMSMENHIDDDTVGESYRDLDKVTGIDVAPVTNYGPLTTVTLADPVSVDGLDDFRIAYDKNIADKISEIANKNGWAS